MTRRMILAGVAIAAAACGIKKESKFDFGEPKSRYQLKGVIVALKPEDRVAEIKHEKIEGWMEAMTMEFPVPAAGEFAKLKVGALIRATVCVNDANFWLTGVTLE